MYFLNKSKIWVKNSNFGQKFKFWSIIQKFKVCSKIQILVKNSNRGVRTDYFWTFLIDGHKYFSLNSGKRLIKLGKHVEALNLEESLKIALHDIRSIKKCENDRFAWNHIETVLRRILAPLKTIDFSFANSESISLGVLVEEVLIECEDTIGVRRKNTGKWHSTFSEIFVFTKIFVHFYAYKNLV